MSKTIRFKALSVTAAAGLALAGAADARGPQGPVPGKPGDQNIVEIAVGVNLASTTPDQPGEFSYLLAAATCDYFEGAIVDLLTGSDMYTLFAPTDAAFIKLQTEVLAIAEPSPAATCSLPQAVLFDVLAYHVTEGRRFSNSVFNRNATKPVGMLNGQYIIANPDLTIDDINGQEIGVVAPQVNINASNGVIHVIDTVLLP